MGALSRQAARFGCTVNATADTLTIVGPKRSSSGLAIIDPARPKRRSHYQTAKSRPLRKCRYDSPRKGARSKSTLRGLQPWSTRAATVTASIY